MFRMLAVGFALAAASVASAQPTPAKAKAEAKPPAPVAAKTVTLEKSGTLGDATKELTKQTELVFDLGSNQDAPVKAAFKNVPFWEAVEGLAEQAKCFVSVQGGKVKFTKRPDGVGAVPSNVGGPFRVVLKKVVAKRDLESAGTEYELLLEVQWEPRFPVYLIDTEPTATGKAGQTNLTANAASVRTLPTGKYTHDAVVRLKNVPREVKTLDELAGTLRLIAANKMVAVEFNDLTDAKPQTQSKDGVSVTLQPAKVTPNRVTFRVDLEYPESHPTFESFQSWTGANVFRLYPPRGGAGLTTDKYSTDTDQGRKQTLSYHFPGGGGGADLKDWRAVYETPGPLSEQKVEFKLKSIPLP